MMKDDKKVFSGVFVLVMLFCTLFAISVPTSAATYGSGTQTHTITVVTKSNYWIFGSGSIALSQSKRTCVKKSYTLFTGKTKKTTSKQYGEWDIVAKATDGSHTFKKTLIGSSVKLNLKPNKTYGIPATRDRNAAVLKGLSKGPILPHLAREEHREGQQLFLKSNSSIPRITRPRHFTYGLQPPAKAARSSRLELRAACVFLNLTPVS